MYYRRPTYPGQQVPMNPNQSMYTGPAVYPGQPAYPGRQVPIHSFAPAYPGQPTYPNQPSYTSQISYLGQQFRPQYGGSLQYQQNGFMDPPAVWKRSERCLEGLKFQRTRKLIVWVRFTFLVANHKLIGRAIIKWKTFCCSFGYCCHWFRNICIICSF